MKVGDRPMKANLQTGLVKFVPVLRDYVASLKAGVFGVNRVRSQEDLPIVYLSGTIFQDELQKFQLRERSKANQLEIFIMLIKQ